MVSSKSVTIFIVFLTLTAYGDEARNGTIANYDATELLLKIFNPNTIQARQRGNSFKFEEYPSGPSGEDQHQYINYENKPLKFEDSGQIDDNFKENPLRFEDEAQELDQYDSEYGPNFDDNKPFKFDERPQILDQNEERPLNFETEIPNDGTPLKFQDSDPDVKGGSLQNDNSIRGHNKKKRKRRRKPKRLPNQPGLGRPEYAGALGGTGYPGVPGGPGYQGVPGAYQGYGAGYGYPGLQGVPYRRPRRPRRRPSLTSDALTAVTGALTSIALYDDYQCVPRLLCEAAGGGALGSAGVLDSVAGIQPLLTLLSAYNGISSSPLFVFGRAVFLGMTSKGNTGTCRYAYSQCPTDPEQLIYYLNNHNGGFFRFFNAPPNQNLQQFYQHLGQNFNQNGPYPLEHYQNGQYPADYYNQNGQYPPYYQAGQNFNQNQQYPGDYNQIAQNYQNGQYQNQDGYGLFPQSLYGSQNYGQNYDYNKYSKISFRDSKEIEDRIQNKPAQEAEDQFDDEIYEYDPNNNVNTNFAFPDNYKPTDSTNNDSHKTRDNKALRFPEDQNLQTNTNRKQKAVNFPNTNNYPNRYNNNQNRIKYVNYNDFKKIKQQPNNQNNNNNYQIYYNPSNNNYPYNQNDLHNNNFKQQPNNHNNNYYHYNNNYNNDNIKYNPHNKKHQNHNVLNNEDYYYDHKHGFYVKKENNNAYNTGNNNAYNNGISNAYNIGNHKVYDHDSNKVYNNGNNNAYNNGNSNAYNIGNHKVYDHDSNKVYNNGNNNAYNNGNNNAYVYGNNNAYNNGNNKVYDKHNNGANIVYIVRGNGDPNHPEIVQVKPGQSVY